MLKRNFLAICLWVSGYASTPAPVYGQTEEPASQSPFVATVAYTGDLYANVAGGVDGGIRYMDNIDVNVRINFEALPWGLKGTTFYIYGLGNQGGKISELTGDIQGISNIEGDNSWRIFEVWAQKKFFLANSSILLGLYDINSEFNVLNNSLLFINSSQGLDPTLALSGVLGPSTFPYTSLGGRLKINPAGGWILQATVVDGVPSNPDNPEGTKIFWRKRDGLLLIAETAFYSVGREGLQFRNRTARLQHFLDPSISGERQFKFSVGGWMYSRKRNGWDTGSVSKRDMGIYGAAELKVVSEAGDPYQGLSAFGRLSLANEAVTRVAGFMGGGLVYTGLFRVRDRDRSGISFAHAINSTAYRDQRFSVVGIRPEKRETNFELTYLAELSPFVKVQGDVQFITNPGMNPALENTVVTGLRVLLSF